MCCYLPVIKLLYYHSLIIRNILYSSPIITQYKDISISAAAASFFVGLTVHGIDMRAVIVVFQLLWPSFIIAKRFDRVKSLGKYRSILSFSSFYKSLRALFVLFCYSFCSLIMTHDYFVAMNDLIPSFLSENF